MFSEEVWLFLFFQKCFVLVEHFFVLLSGWTLKKNKNKTGPVAVFAMTKAQCNFQRRFVCFYFFQKCFVLVENFFFLLLLLCFNTNIKQIISTYSNSTMNIFKLNPKSLLYNLLRKMEMKDIFTVIMFY